MARRRKHKVSGWTVFGAAILLGCLIGPTVMAVALLVAVLKALKRAD